MDPRITDDWDGYLKWFHEHRAGITEQILSRSATEGGLTPYGWIASAVPPSGLIVDVACGSAPLWNNRLSGRYLGADLSAAELELARARGAHDLALASAAELPVYDAAASAVICSMALMVLPDVLEALAEARRALRREGVFVATVPTTPAGVGDFAVTAGLVRAVGRLGYRNDDQLRKPNQLFERAGLRIQDDSRETFLFEIRGSEDARAMAASLYLPRMDARKFERAVGFFEHLAEKGRAMPIPLRRIIALPMGNPNAD